MCLSAFDQLGGTDGTVGDARSILVTDYTHRLTDGYFEFKDLGKAQIKGVRRAAPRLRGPRRRPAKDSTASVGPRGLTRFVGRHSELEQMRRALDKPRRDMGKLSA